MTVAAIAEPRWHLGNPWGWAIYVPISLVFLGALLLNRSRTRVVIGPDALTVGRLTARSTSIDFDRVRSVRVQPLQDFFAGDRGKLLRQYPELKERPALFLRLQTDDAGLNRLRRQLGRLYVDRDVVALPVEDPPAMLGELRQRLPQGTTPTNRGGGRRGRRRR